MTDMYIEHISAEKIPSIIYGKNTKVQVDLTRFRADTFTKSHGFSINQQTPDLGNVNGQEPNKEMDKLIQAVIKEIVTAFHNTRLTLNDFRYLTRTPFQHLSGKSFHASAHDAESVVNRLKQNSGSIETKN